MAGALLLMDVQNDIVRRLAADGAYLDRVVEAQRRAENAGWLVVLVRTAFRSGHCEICSRNPAFSRIREEGWMLLDTEDVEPHPALRRGKGELVVTKKRVSAFAGSDLEQVLRGRGVTSLALGGIATSGVVLSTVRAASDLDYALTVLHDACWDADPEVHRVLTEKVFPRQGAVCGVEEWQPAAAAEALSA